MRSQKDRALINELFQKAKENKKIVRKLQEQLKQYYDEIKLLRYQLSLAKGQWLNTQPGANAQENNGQIRSNNNANP